MDAESGKGKSRWWGESIGRVCIWGGVGKEICTVDGPGPVGGLGEDRWGLLTVGSWRGGGGVGNGGGGF